MSDQLLLERIDYLSGTPASSRAVQLLQPEFFHDKSPEEIDFELGRLVCNVFLDPDNSDVVAVSVLNPNLDRGDILLEYLVVDPVKQGMGYGREAVKLTLAVASDMTSDPKAALKGVALADALSFYTALGAEFDPDEGTFFFPLGTDQDGHIIEYTNDLEDETVDPDDAQPKLTDDEYPYDASELDDAAIWLASLNT